jgi:hypothetical protein
VLRPNEVDLGTLFVGAEKRFTSLLRNEGRDMIVIESILANCGCSDIKVEATRLRPGEETAISGLYRAGTEAGPFRKRLSVSAKGSTVQKIELFLTGRTERTVVVSPESLILRPDVLKESGATGQFTVCNKSDEVLRLGEVLGLPDGMSVRLAKSILQPNERTDATVTIGSTALTIIDSEITFTSSHSREGRVSAQVRILPIGAVEVLPKALRLGVVSRTELLQRKDLRIVLRGPALDHLVFLDVSAPPQLKTSIIRSRGETAFLEMNVSIVDAFVGADLTGIILVRFRTKDQQRECNVRIPVSGILRDAG